MGAPNISGRLYVIYKYLEAAWMRIMHQLPRPAPGLPARVHHLLHACAFSLENQILLMNRWQNPATGPRSSVLRKINTGNITSTTIRPIHVYGSRRIVNESLRITARVLPIAPVADDALRTPDLCLPLRCLTSIAMVQSRRNLLLKM